jgi:hypothetical protein
MVMADIGTMPPEPLVQSTQVRARTRLQAVRMVLPAYGPIGRRPPSVTLEVRHTSRRNDRPGQTRRETGTQSQGPPSSHGGRPAAGPLTESAHCGGIDGEGEPGALHGGPDAPGICRHVRGRRNALVTAMTTTLKTQGWRIVLALSALASYGLVLEAGRRWC